MAVDVVLTPQPRVVTASLVVLGLLSMAAYEECQQQFTTCVPFPQKGAQETCGGAVPGGDGDPTAVPTPPLIVWETLGGNYANQAPCSGGTGDPIGTVFIMAAGGDAGAATDLANNRLSDIGMTTGYGNPLPGGPDLTSRENFLDNGGCIEGDITRATNGGWHVGFCDFLPYCIDSRWHVRCIVHAQPSAYGYWASCTPHWDSGPPPDCPRHYVPATYNGTEDYGGSGYDAARDWMWWQLVHDLGMTDAGPVFFDNQEPRSQCGGSIYARADGKVNVTVLQ